MREREQKGRLSQTGAVSQIVGERRRGISCGDRNDTVAVDRRRSGHALRRLREEQGRMSVDLDDGVVEFDPFDGREALEVVRTHRQGQDEGVRAVVLDLDVDQLAPTVLCGRPGGVHPVHRISAGHPHAGLDHGCARQQGLAHGHLTGREVPAVLRPDPPVERPSIDPRDDESARVDDGLPRRVDVADRRPVAPGHVGQLRRVPPRHELGSARVELAVQPVRPDPSVSEARNVADGVGILAGPSANRSRHPTALGQWMPCISCSRLRLSRPR